MIIDSAMHTPRIVHFTSAHPPFDTRIFHKECRTLADAGYEVTLFAPEAPVGMSHGVQLRAIPRERGRVRRLVLGNLRLLRKLLVHNADVYHFHDPELLPLGVLLRLARRHVVYDAHEHVRFSIGSRDYLPRAVRRIFARSAWLFEQFVSRLGAHVIAATPTIASQFPTGRCTVVGNYPNLVEFEDALSDSIHRNTTTGVYIGGLSEERCLEEVYEALDIVRRSDDRLTLVMAGPVDGVEHPADIKGVDYRGVVDRPTVARLIAGSAFGLVLFHALPNTIDALPTKFFEYAAAGTPVIVSASTVQLARIAEEEGCGLVVDQESPQAIADAMTWMVDHPGEARAMGERARQATVAKYHWGPEATRLLDLYGRLLGT